MSEWVGVLIDSPELGGMRKRLAMMAVMAGMDGDDYRCLVSEEDYG